MSKKFIAATVAGLSLLAFSVFSFSNALALSHETGDMWSAPLTSPRTLCREARANYRRDVEQERAKGLSSQLPQEDIDLSIQAIKDYRMQVCAEAAALTSSVKLCKEAKKNYRRDIKDARAKGLSSSLSAEEVREEIKRMIREIKDYRIKVCKEAKAEQKAEKDAPRRAMEAQYAAAKERCEHWLANKDDIIADIRSTGERLDLSEEEIEQEIKNKDGSSDCEQAKVLKKKLEAM